MKKLTAILVTGAMLFSQTFAQGITVSTTEETITITVDMGDHYIGQKVGYELFRPAKSISDVTGTTDGDYTLYDSATVLSALESVGEGTVGADGKATFTITPRIDAVSGFYDITAGVKTKTLRLAEKFPFAPKSAVDTLLASIQAPTATESTIANLFVDPADPDVLAGFEVLGLTEYPEYAIYQGETYGGAATRAKLHSVLLNDLKGKNYNKAQVGTTFQNAVYRAVVLALKDNAKLIEFMEANPAKTGLSLAKLYTDVYSDTTLFTATDKTALAAKLTSHPWTGTETLPQITDVIDEYIFMQGVTTLTDGYGKIGTMIDLGEDVLTAHYAVLTNYDTSVKETVWQAVSTATTMTEFVSLLNTAIEENQQSNTGGNVIITPPTNPQGGITGGVTGSLGGGTFGGGGGGGGSVGGGAATGNTGSGTPQAPVIFTDLEGVEWAEEAITELYKMGIISGNGDQTFAPENPMKRSEFLKILMLGLGLVDETAQAEFEDVAPDSWYYIYVASAYKLGIANGYENKFSPDDTITREDAATMIYRCVSAAGKQLPELKADSSFDDHGDISEYAQEAVNALYKAEIINGMSETEFSPKTDITRAQAAKMIYGLINSLK